MKSSERHQLKQNPFAVAAMQAVDYVTANGRRVGVIAAVVVVLVVAVAGMITLARQRADRAGTLLGIAMATAQAQIAPDATLPGVRPNTGTFSTEAARSEATFAAFREVIDAYPDSDAAKAARFHLAGESLAEGRLDDAERLFREAANGGGRSVYGASAQLGLAEVLTATGRYDEAIALLNELAATRDGAVPVDGVLMQLGETNLTAGRESDAEAAFRRVVDEFPTSVYLTDAETRLGDAAP